MHGEHADAPLDALKVSIGQAWQAVAAALSEKLPGVQAVHTRKPAEMKLSLWLNCPGWQVAQLVRFCEGCCPAGQSRQAWPCSANCVAGQGTQSAWPEPVATLPGAQATQAVAAAWDAYLPEAHDAQGGCPLELNWPTEHEPEDGAAQARAPGPRVTWPCLHGSHCVCPNLALKEPCPHSSHTLLPCEEEKLPGPQGEHR